MQAYFIYLAETSICLLVLFVFYKLFLSRLTFYHTRRVFLVVSVLLSCLIPALNVKISNFSSPVPPFSYQIDRNTQQQAQPELTMQRSATGILQNQPETVHPQPTLPKLLLVVYLAGVFLLLLKFVMEVFKLIRLSRKSPVTQCDGLIVYQQSSSAPAFSFFNRIFVNPKLLNPEEMKFAIAHEVVHVREKHFYDLLFFEAFKILLWFNPVAYLIKKEAQKVHEYLADQKTCETAGRYFYAQMLLRQAQTARQPGLVHSFALLPLKPRIRELFKVRSSGTSSLRLIFLTPIILFLFITFSCSNEFEPGNLSMLPDGIKSIKVVYHDEYGDMPQYDGQYYSWAKFDRAGNLTELKKGTLHENSSDEYNVVMNNQSYPSIQPDKIIWYLDYHFYYDQTQLLFENPNDYAKAKIKDALELRKNTGTEAAADITQNEKGLPLKIKTSFDLENERGRSASIIWNEAFQYDDQGRLIKSVFSSHSPIRNNNRSVKVTTIEYTPDGKVGKVISGNLACQLFYNENGKISEININKIKFIYFYNDMGLRTKSLAYNASGELEYRLAYEYKFY